MDVLEAIHERRSVGRVKADPVPKEMIETLLEAAVRAPNHYRTEPWRFIVLTGDGRKRLSAVMEEIAKEGMENPEAEENRRIWEAAGKKAYRAPVIIIAIVEPSDHPKAIAEEESAAVHAAIQNMLLAAAGLGLGAMWRTGSPAYHPITRQRFGLSEKARIAGFIYVGFPETLPPLSNRAPAAAKTTWYEE